MAARQFVHTLLAMLGLGGPALASEAPSFPDLLVDKTWEAAGEDAQPGTTRLFRSNGTLLWESPAGTFHRANWSGVAANQLVWQEDGIDVAARIERLTETELVLALDLVSGPLTHRYVAAPLPGPVNSDEA